jgi:hypothetical protein
LELAPKNLRKVFMSQASNGKNVMVQGRIVWVSGDLWKGKGVVDDRTKQPKIDQKTGLQIIQYGFGLAVPKTSLNNNPEEIWAALHMEAAAIYPSGLPPDFAKKFKDGDTDVDQNGVPFNQREGYPGHMVFACTTQIPIKFFKFENGANIQVSEGIKCGDYVNVQLGVKAHGKVGQGKPGMYLNPMAVQLIGYGKEIINSPSGDQIFGLQQPAIPQGASAMPLAPQGNTPLMPVNNGFPPPHMAAQPPAMPPAQPAGYAPHYGILPTAHQPQNAQPAFAPPPTGMSPGQAPAMMPPAQPMGYPQQPPAGYPPVQGAAPTMPPSYPQQMGTTPMQPVAMPQYGQPQAQQPMGFAPPPTGYPPGYQGQ